MQRSTAVSALLQDVSSLNSGGAFGCRHFFVRVARAGCRLMAMADLIETLLGLSPGAPLTELRAERADIRRHTQGAYRELVTPAEPGGLTLPERAGLALRVARGEGDARLAAHFESLGPAAGDSGRMPLLLPYADLVARQAGQVGQGHIDALRGAGLSPQDVVAVTQLVAFVPFQVRVLAGLRAMLGADGVGEAVHPVAAPVRFTMAEVAWSPRVPPVEADGATPAQLAALDACPPAVRRSTYFLTLALDPASLGERGALFNSVMYAPRGLPRAERELATAVVSMVNGCVYCCSVHARRFAELTRDPAPMQRLLDEGFGTLALEPRQAAIVAFAAKLTAAPGQVRGTDLVPLREEGLAPLALLDLVHAIAMFANANRLMQALGDSVPP